MPANLRSADDANAQALVESYLNTHPKATRAEAVAAVPGAEEVYEHLDEPAEVYIVVTEEKEYDETPARDWFYADPKADDLAARKAGYKEENVLELDDEDKLAQDSPDPDHDVVVTGKDRQERKEQVREEQLEVLEAAEAAREKPADNVPDEEREDDLDFDPADHNADKVVEHVEKNPEQRDAVLEAERQGKNRKTVVEALQD